MKVIHIGIETGSQTVAYCNISEKRNKVKWYAGLRLSDTLSEITCKKCLKKYKENPSKVEGLK